jgi:hypothetical protein
MTQHLKKKPHYKATLSFKPGVTAPSTAWEATFPSENQANAWLESTIRHELVWNQRRKREDFIQTITKL